CRIIGYRLRPYPAGPGTHMGGLHALAVAARGRGRAVHAADAAARGLAARAAHRAGPPRPAGRGLAPVPARAAAGETGGAAGGRRGGWRHWDSRTGAAVDSRTFGPVPPGLIEGRVLLRYRRGRDRS